MSKVVLGLLALAAAADTDTRQAIACTGTSQVDDTVGIRPWHRRTILPDQVYVFDEARRTVLRALPPLRKLDAVCDDREKNGRVDFASGCPPAYDTIACASCR